MGLCKKDGNYLMQGPSIDKIRKTFNGTSITIEMLTIYQ